MHEPSYDPESPRWWWIWIASAIAWPVVGTILSLFFGNKLPFSIGEIIWCVVGPLSFLGGVVSSIVLAQRCLFRRGRSHPATIVGLSLLFMLGAAVLFVASLYAACLVTL